jgi:hypothetical protein
MKSHDSTGIPTAKVVKCILSMSTNLCRSVNHLARNTVTLPACVVKTIREEFLSPDGNYEGFKECACESDISDSE